MARHPGSDCTRLWLFRSCVVTAGVFLSPWAAIAQDRPGRDSPEAQRQVSRDTEVTVERERESAVQRETQDRGPDREGERRDARRDAAPVEREQDRPAARRAGEDDRPRDPPREGDRPAGEVRRDADPDREAPGRDIVPNIKIIRLRASDAETMSQLIRSLFAGPSLRVAAEPRTNSLVIISAPRDLATIEALMMQLDSDESVPPRRPAAAAPDRRPGEQPPRGGERPPKRPRDGAAGAALQIEKLPGEGAIVIRGGEGQLGAVRRVLNQVGVTPTAQPTDRDDRFALVVSAPPEQLRRLNAALQEVTDLRGEGGPPPGDRPAARERELQERITRHEQELAERAGVIDRLEQQVRELRTQLEQMSRESAGRPREGARGGREDTPREQRGAPSDDNPFGN